MRAALPASNCAAASARKAGPLPAWSTLTEAQQVAGDAAGGDVVRVHDALLAFEQVDARAAKVVELRFFGGLENTEIAELLGLSLATVKRDWTLARAWLHRELAA